MYFIRHLSELFEIMNTAHPSTPPCISTATLIINNNMQSKLDCISIFRHLINQKVTKEKNNIYKEKRKETKQATQIEKKMIVK